MNLNPNKVFKIMAGARTKRGCRVSKARQKGSVEKENHHDFDTASHFLRLSSLNFHDRRIAETKQFRGSKENQNLDFPLRFCVVFEKICNLHTFDLRASASV